MSLRRPATTGQPVRAGRAITAYLNHLADQFAEALDAIATLLERVDARPATNWPAWTDSPTLELAAGGVA